MSRLSRLRLGLVLLGVIYIALRLALIWRLPIFYDEGLYAADAQIAFDHPARETLLLAVGDRHGPLQPLLALPPLAAGIPAITAVRLVSLVAGLVAAAGVGVTGARLAGRRAGLVAAALWIVLPFPLIYDSLGLAESLATAAIAWAMYLQLRVAERPSVRGGVVLGAVMGLGILAKPSVLIAVALAPFALLAFDWRREDRGRRLGVLAAAFLAAGLLVAVAAKLPELAPRHLRVTGALAGALQTHTFADAIGNYATLVRGNAPEFNRAVGGYFGIPLVALAAVGAGMLLRSRNAADVFVIVWLVVPTAAVYTLAVTPYARYLTTALPAFLVVAAVPLARLRPLPAAGAAALVLALPLALTARTLADPWHTDYPSLDGAQFVSFWPAGTPWPTVADALASRSPRRGSEVAFDGVRFPPMGLAAELGAPSLSVTPDGRSPPGVLHAARGSQRFTIRPLDAGSPRPEFILEQAQAGAPAKPPGGGYRLVLTYKRPHRGAHVTLWQRGSAPPS